MRPRRALQAAFGLCAVATVLLALGWLDAPSPPDGVQEPQREASHAVPRPPPARLEGRERAADQPIAEPPRAGPPPAPAPTGTLPRPANVSARGPGGAVPVEAPRAPGRPAYPDPDLGDPRHTLWIPRRDLVPALSDPSWRPAAWEGVAKVDHTEAGDAVDEDIVDPLVTAVFGTVIDTAGEPVLSALVILYSSFYQRHARYDHHVREVGRTTTDADGRFDLRPIGLDTVHFGENGEVLLTVRREGYGAIAAERLDNIDPEVANDLGLFVLTTKAARLTGIVRDLAGQPVPGAAVRVSGRFNPVYYDKTERMIVLKDCPTAVTNDDGRYALDGFAPGRQHVSVHVNIDCVLHFDTSYSSGEQEWSPRVRAGGSVRGRVIDGHGDLVAAAVVSGGGNWTPSNPDGTFWLDNIDAGPFQLEIAHHAYRTVFLEGVAAGTEELEVVLVDLLPVVELRVVDEKTGAAVDLIEVQWTWPPGRSPGPFVPDSPFWHGEGGRYEVTVPEHVIGAQVSATGHEAVAIEAEEFVHGAAIEVVLGVK